MDGNLFSWLSKDPISSNSNSENQVHIVKDETVNRSESSSSVNTDSFSCISSNAELNHHLGGSTASTFSSRSSSCSHLSNSPVEYSFPVPDGRSGSTSRESHSSTHSHIVDAHGNTYTNRGVQTTGALSKNELLLERSAIGHGVGNILSQSLHSRHLLQQSFNQLVSTPAAFEEGARFYLGKLKLINLTSCIVDFIHGRGLQKTAALIRAFEMYDSWWTFRITELPSIVLESFITLADYAIRVFPGLSKIFIGEESDSSETDSIELQGRVNVNIDKLAPILDFLGIDVVEGKAWLEQNPAATAVVAVVLTIGVMFTGYHLTKAIPFIRGFVKDVATIGLEIRGWKEVWQCGSELFKLITNWMFTLFGVEFDLNYDPKIEKLVDDLSGLNKELNRFKEKISTDLEYVATNPEYINRTNTLISRSEKMNDFLARNHKINTRNAMNLLRDNEKCVEFIRKFKIEYMKSHSTRIEPVVIMLSGEPGVGKTRTVEMLRSKLSNLLKRNLSLYVKNHARDEFWSGYLGQDMVLLDDFGQFAEDTDHTELIQMVGTQSLPLNMADVAEKGRLFISPFIILTSNYHTVARSASVNSTEAVNRRIRYRYLVTNSKCSDIRNRAGRVYDPLTDGEWEPSKYFHIRRQFDITENDKVDLKDLDANEVSLDQIADLMYRLYCNNRDEYLQGLQKTFKKTVKLVQSSLDCMPPSLGELQEIAVEGGPSMYNAVVEMVSGVSVDHIEQQALLKEQRAVYDLTEKPTQLKADYWLLEGPPGVGKTTILEATEKYFREEGYSILNLPWSKSCKPAFEDLENFGCVILDDYSQTEEALQYAINFIAYLYQKSSKIKCFVSINTERALKLLDCESIRILRRRCRQVLFEYKFCWSRLRYYNSKDVENIVSKRGLWEKYISVSLDGVEYNHVGVLTAIRHFKFVPQNWAFSNRLPIVLVNPNLTLKIDRTEKQLLKDLMLCSTVPSLILYFKKHIKKEGFVKQAIISFIGQIGWQIKDMIACHAAYDENDTPATSLVEGLINLNSKMIKSDIKESISFKMEDCEFVITNQNGYVVFGIRKDSSVPTPDLPQKPDIVIHDRKRHWFTVGYEKLLETYPSLDWTFRVVNLLFTFGGTTAAMYGEIDKYNSFQNNIIEEEDSEDEWDEYEFQGKKRRGFGKTKQSTAVALARRKKGFKRYIYDENNRRVGYEDEDGIHYFSEWELEAARRPKNVYDMTPIKTEEPKYALESNEKNKAHMKPKNQKEKPRLTRLPTSKWQNQSNKYEMREVQNRSIYKKFFDHCIKNLKTETTHKNRRVVWYGSFDYGYANQELKAKPCPEWVSELEDYLIEEGIDITSKHRGNVLINIYENGNDYIGWHSDNELCIDQRESIISFSLGAGRIFKIKDLNTKEIEEIYLPNGSVFIMPPGFQKNYEHCLPVSRSDVGPRVSFTWRCYNTPLDGDLPEHEYHFESMNTQLRNIYQLAYNNMGLIYTEYGNLVCAGLMLYDRIGVTVAHIVKDDEDLYFTCMQNGNEIRAKMKFVKITKSKEIAVFVLDKTVQPFKDIRKHLMSRDSDEVIEGKEGILVVKHATHPQSALYTVYVNYNSERRIENQIREGYVYAGHVTGLNLKGLIFTAAGDCGAVLISGNLKTNPKICGLHFAAEWRHGMASVLFRELFEDQDWKFQSGNYEVSPGPFDNWTKLNDIKILGNDMKLIGYTNLNVHRPTKTQVYRSPLAIDVYGDNFEPSVLSIHDDRVNIEEDPLETALFRWDKIQPNINSDDLAVVVEDVANHLATILKQNNKKCRVHSKKEAINSCSEYEKSNPIFRQSSAGYPWSVYPGVSKKNTYIVPTDAKSGVNHMVLNLSHPLGKQLNAAVDYMIEEARRGRRTGALFQTHLKDEVLKKKKIYDVIGTRPICGAPLHLVIAHRMYFMGAINCIMECQAELPPKAGIDPLSMDWSKLWFYLSRNSTIGFDADFKNWDSNVPLRIMESLPHVYNRIYQLCDPHWKIEDDAIRIALHSHMHKPLLSLDGAILQAPGGQVSGQPGTTMDNCISNMIYYGLAWRHIMREAGRQDLISMHHFHENVSYAVYGDDNIASIKDGIKDIFNLHSFSKFCEEVLNVEVTSAQKDKDLYKYKNLNECEFLKRNFRKISENVVVGPVVDSTMDKLLNWVTHPQHHVITKDNLMNIQYEMRTIEQECEDVLVEAAYRSRAEYNYMFSHCLKVLQEIGSTKKLPNFYDCFEVHQLPVKQIEGFYKFQSTTLTPFTDKSNLPGVCQPHTFPNRHPQHRGRTSRRQ